MVGRGRRAAPADVEHGSHPWAHSGAARAARSPRELLAQQHGSYARCMAGSPGAWRSWVPSRLCPAASLGMLKRGRGPSLRPAPSYRGLDSWWVGLLSPSMAG